MTPYHAAVRYHVNCERYDQRICTGMGRDGVVPANSWEYGKVQSNAASEHARAMRDAGIPGEEMDKIIRDERVIQESIRIVRNNEDITPIRYLRV